MGLPYAQESNLYAACFIRGSNKSFCHPPYNLPFLNSMEKNNNSVTDIPTMTNLRLGRRKEYEGGDHRNFCFPAPVGPAKRSRASSQNMLNPCCQVEGCSLDLKSAKDYHRRHRICETHSKSPTVVVAGMERRFCQQCSRFHDLSEFDDKKRSCRRRLSDHNARRRRGVQPESSVQILSSALYDQRQHNYLPLNGLTVPLSNSDWEDANAYMLRQGKSIFELHMDLDKYNHRVLDQCSEIQTAPPYLLNAHSLLSTSSWSLSEGQSTTNSMDSNYNNHHHHHHHHHYYHQGISHQLFKEVAAYNTDDFCSTQK